MYAHMPTGGFKAFPAPKEKEYVVYHYVGCGQFIEWDGTEGLLALMGIVA